MKTIEKLKEKGKEQEKPNEMHNREDEDEDGDVNYNHHCRDQINLGKSKYEYITSIDVFIQFHITYQYFCMSHFYYIVECFSQTVLSLCFVSSIFFYCVWHGV